MGFTLWSFASLPWKITMLLIGKPSISMSHLYRGELLNNQRVTYLTNNKCDLSISTDGDLLQQ